MQISFVIPTQNRPRELAYTLDQLQSLNLDQLGGDFEVIIVDNASDCAATAPSKLDNGMTVTMIHLDENMGAGARNIGAQHAKAQWIIMLDDDSHLCSGPVGQYLAQVDPSTAIVGGEILLPDGSHEAGGLPEVPVGCGCAIRRDAFLEVGGYDSTFGYYVEEYDLSAKLIAADYSIHHSRTLKFEHRKTITGRDFNQILYRLVRNNGWVIERYAPAHLKAIALTEMLERYRQIGIKEQAIAGYEQGCAELERTIGSQPIARLNDQQWDRFTGKSAAKQALKMQLAIHSSQSVSIVGPPRGKGLEQIKSIIQSMGITIDQHAPNSLQVIGTLSPGPMLDAKQAYLQAICPWDIEELASIKCVH
ncbi:MAG: glycosyltransferase [Phycisphaerales bacterium]|nr:glycosyltransferase [Phycisphaerales bacterium]